MAAKSVNLIKYLIKGKESRRKALLKELAAVEGQVKKLKNDMKNAAKREAAARKAKKKKK
ncbi:MAG TPA: hypothetical protein PLM53_18750 [Spirochaetota bacterium]|nr:hypothetical protein [Spirochaetota bacterium]HQF10259.1 hypothetical protein [Spirochaetota bacterium]HQH99137.1 hypothetical protein [Spirochaetota bacterium]